MLKQIISNKFSPLFFTIIISDRGIEFLPQTLNFLQIYIAINLVSETFDNSNSKFF